MSLAPGTRLGPYEITAVIGAGGMGDVYRARDTRLDRTVAIKVLPEHIAAEPASRERFEREAKSISSLNHPNICTLYDVGREATTDFLVMELVSGETLEDRIRLGALPLDEALAIARQITLALEAAHDHGIVHRDLKPANIKVTPEGQVKVLDFGLAKAFAPDGSDSSLANSPTFTALGPTQAGVILGTAAYMSPEQARGQALDKRTDVWAFGCVLFEMLTGRQAFPGDTATDTLAAIVTKTPEWSALPVDTPAAIRRLLRRCLEKERKLRLRDVADARLDLDEALAGPDRSAALPAGSARRASPTLMALVAVVGLVVAVAGFVAGTQWSGPRMATPRQWYGEQLGGSAIAFEPTISPDGRMLAFQAMDDGMTQVAVMTPDSGNWDIRTRDRTRGNVQDLCWSIDGTRIFFDRVAGVPTGIFSVPVFGGEERLVVEDAMAPRALPDGSLLVTKVNAEHRQQLHRFWPKTQRLQPLGAILNERFIGPALEPFPDGREAVFYGRPAASVSQPDHLYAIDLTTGRSRRLAPTVVIPADVWMFPIAATGDRVLFNLASGDLSRIVAVPRDGSDGVEPLLTLSARPLYLNVGPDGSLYVDQGSRELEILRYQPVTRQVRRTLLTTGADTGFSELLPLGRGRLLASQRAAGRHRVMLIADARGPEVFVDTAEETNAPLTMIGQDRVGLLIGNPPKRRVAIVSASDGRIIRELKGVDGDSVVQLAGAPNGRDLYYVAAGAVWVIPTEDGEPRRIRSGNRVAVYPNGSDLLIQLAEEASTRLIRVPLAGGPEVSIPLPAGFQLSPSGFPTAAIGPDNRLIIRVSTRGSWYWPLAILEPGSGRFDVIDAGEDLDMHSGGWTPEGDVVTLSNPTVSSLWRFRPVERK